LILTYVGTLFVDQFLLIELDLDLILHCFVDH